VCSSDLLLERARRSRGLEDCLVAEFRAACSLLRGPDLYEGIRAAIIDKDKAPVWRPAAIEAVGPGVIAAILAGDDTPDPVFDDVSEATGSPGAPRWTKRL
jgi:enoyl-CoA hydratase